MSDEGRFRIYEESKNVDFVTCETIATLVGNRSLERFCHIQVCIEYFEITRTHKKEIRFLRSQ